MERRMDTIVVRSANRVGTDGEVTSDGLLGLQATIDLAPIGLAQFDHEGRFLLANDRLCEILGCARTDLLARTFQEITFPEDLGRCLELTGRLAASEIPSYCVDKRFVRPDGSIVWTRITVSAVRRTDGTVAFFIGAAEDITKQVEATEALRTTEERLATALDASQIGTFRFDVRRNVLEWADGLERVFGSSQNITLDQFFEAIHPDDRATVMAAYTKSVAEGVAFEENFRVIWPDGSTHWLHDRGRIVPGTDRTPHYIVGAITDISNRKHIEQVLHEREAQFSTLANTIPQMAWIANSDGTRSWHNDRWLEYTGTHPDDALGLGWMRAHESGGEAQEVLASQRAAFHLGSAWERTVRLRRKDGAYRWFLSRAMPVREPDGHIKQWVGTNTDISDRLEAERALTASEERLRRAIEIETVGVVFFSMDGQITGANDAFLRMGGYTREDVQTGRVRRDELTPAEFMPQSRRAVEEFTATGRTTPYEKQYLRKDGSRWWALFAATRLNDTEGVEFVLDVSEQKEAELELERSLGRERLARAEAEHAVQAREEVLSVLSHDLRNPMHTILAAASILATSATNEKQQRPVTIIQRATQGMERLVNDLLDMARIDAGAFTVRKEPLDIGAVIRELVELFEPQALAKQIVLRAELQEGIPPVQADRDRLVQVLSNLVGNALKFTAAGHKVDVREAICEGGVQISVKDSGAGIGEEDLPRIFDRFWQAERAKRAGAGLGLAIAKAIVEAHGGRIWAASKLGRGTTFYVQIPFGSVTPDVNVAAV
jgi:PAS domain S-box-containing protein